MTDMFVLNPILLLDNLASYARYGFGVKFGWDAKAGAFPAVNAMQMLNDYGIKVYGFGMTRKERTFRVRTEQAEWAEWLLLRAGSPLTTRPGYAKNANVQRGPLPPAWGVRAKSVGFAGAFGNLTQRNSRRQSQRQRQQRRQRR